MPAFLALLSLIIARSVHPNRGKPPAPPREQDIPKVFWRYVTASALLACGFIDFPLLAYHIQSEKLFSPEVIPLLYAGAMGVVGLSALICGKLYDRYGIAVLAVGIVLSLLSLPLGFLGGPPAVVAAVACWGIGIGVQDATLRSGIAQVVSMNKRGSAFGVFNGAYGVAWFAGSVVMGLLYSHSREALVAFGVLLQLAAVALFLWVRKPLAAARM